MKHNNQLEAFEAVYKRYRGKCILTGESLQVKQASMFAHILPKGSYPSLKTEDMNIVLVKDIEHHELIDKIVNKIRKELGKQYIIDLIKDGKDIAPLIKEYRQRS